MRLSWFETPNTPTELTVDSAPRKIVWMLSPMLDTMFEKNTGKENRSIWLPCDRCWWPLPAGMFRQAK